MAKERYLSYTGLTELVTKLKAEDTIVKNFAGDLTGKTDKMEMPILPFKHI